MSFISSSLDAFLFEPRSDPFSPLCLPFFSSGIEEFLESTPCSRRIDTRWPTIRYVHLSSNRSSSSAPADLSPLRVSFAHRDGEFELIGSSTSSSSTTPSGGLRNDMMESSGSSTTTESTLSPLSEESREFSSTPCSREPTCELSRSQLAI